MKIHGIVLMFATACSSSAALAQDVPLDVSRCDLAKNPKAFDQKLVRVRGALNVFFEDFSLSAQGCDSHQGVWLAFGGDVPGIIPSTANDNQRKPGEDVNVEGVPYGIEKDENFRKLYALIAARKGEKPQYRVTATLEGKFFAGEPTKGADGVVWYSGYGHLGCCSLFVIQRVSDVASEPHADLNLRGVVLGVDGKTAKGITVIDDVMGGDPPERQTTITGERGEFSFTNSGQQLRIEDPRFRPLAISVEPDGPPVRVRLEDSAKSDWILKPCAQNSAEKRVGFSVQYALPGTMDSTSNEYEDFQAISVSKRGNEKTSADFDINRSKDEQNDAPSSLHTKNFEERWIRDERGEIVGREDSGEEFSGRAKRYRRGVDIFNRESARYYMRSRRGHQEWDRILDSACIARR